MFPYISRGADVSESLFSRGNLRLSGMSETHRYYTKNILKEKVVTKRNLHLH